MTDEFSRNVVLLAVVGVLVVLLADFGVWSWLRKRVSRSVQHVGERLPSWIRDRLYIEAPKAFEQASASVDAGEDAPSADQIYFVTAERLLNSQVVTNDTLDSKNAGTIGVGSTILPLTFGLLSLSSNPRPEHAERILIAVVVVYVLLLAAAARASVIRAIEYRPDVYTVWRHSQDIVGADLRRWIADEYAISVELNRPVLQRKARWVGYASLALYVEGILISAAAVLALSA